MCYEYKRMPRIYNPSTRQLATLPAIESNILAPETYKYYLGHDPVNDQYKVLYSVGRTSGLDILSDHWVFDLKHGGSWKKVALPPPVDFCPHIPIKRGLSINGVIYYLAWIGSYNYVVVSFNIGSEEFKTILIPRKDGDVNLHRVYKNVCLIEYGGKVTVFDNTNLKDTGTVDLWILEDTKKKKWSRKTLVLQSSQLHLVNDIILEATCTTQSGNVLMTPYYLRSPLHILCYDLQSNDRREIEIKGIPDNLFGIPHCLTLLNVMFMDQSESIMYLKT